MSNITIHSMNSSINNSMNNRINNTATTNFSIINQTLLEKFNHLPSLYHATTNNLEMLTNKENIQNNNAESTMSAKEASAIIDKLCNNKKELTLSTNTQDALATDSQNTLSNKKAAPNLHHSHWQFKLPENPQHPLKDFNVNALIKSFDPALIEGLVSGQVSEQDLFQVLAADPSVRQFIGKNINLSVEGLNLDSIIDKVALKHSRVS